MLTIQIIVDKRELATDNLLTVYRSQLKHICLYDCTRRWEIKINNGKFVHFNYVTMVLLKPKHPNCTASNINPITRFSKIPGNVLGIFSKL